MSLASVMVKCVRGVMDDSGVYIARTVNFNRFQIGIVHERNRASREANAKPWLRKLRNLGGALGSRHNLLQDMVNHRIWKNAAFDPQ